MTTKKLWALIGGVGCVAALQGCAVGVEDTTEESTSTVDTSLTSSLTIDSQWNGGYCATVTISNGLSVAANNWTVMLDMKNSTIANAWNTAVSGSGNLLTFKPLSYNSSIGPGQNTNFGFCANAPSWTARAAIAAYNMTSTQYASCNSANGLNPMRAALAVAMATELGRWKPESDLMKAWDGKVAITSAGLAACTNGCPNTKAILGQQDDAVTGFVGQETFNATVYREDMKASFDRQYNKIGDLARNNPGALPPAHKLTLVGGPTNMGNGSCGPHYIYKATDLNGNPLTSAQASNLANALCFYGQGSCGANPYIAFVTTSQGCPSGQTCVAIDPEYGDNGPSGSTSAGSAPTYPANRLYDPTNQYLNTACVTTTGKLGTMKSRCSTNPTTCGYLYCMP